MGLQIFLFVVLAICCYTDMKTKTLPVSVILLGFVGVALGKGMSCFLPADMVGLVPGLLLFFLAKISRKNIGEGDGLVMAFVGWGAGLWMALKILWIASLLCFVLSVLGLCTGQWKRNTTIPYLPFLMAGYGVCQWGGGGW